MSHSDEEVDIERIKTRTKRKIATAENKKRGKPGKLALNMNSTRCDTMRYVTSPKTTIRGFQTLNMYKDDFYERKDAAPGYRYNTNYIGNQVKDNSLKPSVPQFSIGKAPRNIISKYFISLTNI